MKLKIGTKLGLAFAVVLALMIVSGLLTWLRLADIRQNVDRMTIIRVPSMEAARVFQDDLDYASRASAAKPSWREQIQPGRWRRKKHSQKGGPESINQ